MNTYSLARHGRFLWGHERGEGALTMVVKALQAFGKDQTLRIDMDGIEAMDFTFASAFFVTLIRRMGTDLVGYHVVLTNCTPYIEANLDILLAHHGVAVMAVQNQQFKLVGAYTSKYVDVLKCLARIKTGTTSQLAEHLTLSPSTCQKLLSRLVKMGLVGRRKAGKARAPAKYLYSSIIQ